LPRISTNSLTRRSSASGTRGDRIPDTTLHFSSATDQWATPQEVFDWLDGHLGPFDLDAAADATNSKCATHIDADTDALTVPWDGDRVWLNPPYGRGLGRWATKALAEIGTGRIDRLTLLVPARTDTAWFIDLAQRANRIVFVRRRLRFGDGTKDAPFPTAIIVIDREAPVDGTTIDFGINVGDDL